jgi:co-chaperonin GroES (HSP10)
MALPVFLYSKQIELLKADESPNGIGINENMDYGTVTAVAADVLMTSVGDFVVFRKSTVITAALSDLQYSIIKEEDIIYKENPLS